ncbi:MAG: glycoside hydrolase family 88 protein [Paludibacter sp.]|nr:glycoside hydrolase family 88 protein [Paludibacter sp.]
MRKPVVVILSLFFFLSTNFACKKFDYKGWTMRIVKSEMTHNPELWTSDFVKKPSWNYAQALEAKAFFQIFTFTADKKYFDYVHDFTNKLVNDSGEIISYELSKHNIDNLNGGNILIDVYNITKEDKYLKAIQQLRKQLDTQPRVSEGAFWHKSVYPHQVWLDGLYMGSPFYAKQAYTFHQTSDFDDVVKQFIVCDKYTLDPKTGLNFHGWDESRTQIWANSQTGQSPNFWSRSIGWYVMAIVDVLDYLPENHPQRPEMIKILKRVCTSLLPYQDKKTGLWYQVTNFPNRKGNYLESTGTTMFIYAMAKGANKGSLPKKFRKIAENSFRKFTKNCTIINEDGTTTITRSCIVAGLGGSKNRDGSFEYYISEPTRNDDPKAIGPFILAGLELSN